MRKILLFVVFVALPSVVLARRSGLREFRFGSSVAPLPTSEKWISTCGLHHVPLRLGTVPIIYGLIHTDFDYEAAKKKSFPRAQTREFGGCVVMAAKTQIVNFCPQCRFAEKQWLVKHNKPSVKIELLNPDQVVQAREKFLKRSTQTQEKRNSIKK